MNRFVRLISGSLGLLLSSPVFGQTFTFNKLVDTNFAVPGGGFGNFTAVNLAAVDGNSTAFVGSFSSGSQTFSGLFRLDGGVITPISSGAFTSIVASGDYNAGNIVFAGVTTDGLQGLYRYQSGQPLQLLARQGDVLPNVDAGITTTLTSFPARGVSGDADSFSFSAHRSDGADGMYVSPGLVPIVVADERTRAPGPELGQFVDFPEVHLREGRTVFVGRSIDADSDDAAVEPAGVFVATPGNPVANVVFRNQQIPGTEDFRFNEFEKPRIDHLGRVAFTGGFEEDDPALPPERYMGVWAVNPDGTMKIYATSEMTFPGLRAEVDEFWGYTFDGNVPLIGVEDEDGGSYIFIAPDFGPFIPVISSYDMLDGKQLARIRFAGDTIEGNLLTFRATFADGTSGIYAVEVPEPACFAALLFFAWSLKRPGRSF